MSRYVEIMTLGVILLSLLFAVLYHDVYTYMTYGFTTIAALILSVTTAWLLYRAKDVGGIVFFQLLAMFIFSITFMADETGWFIWRTTTPMDNTSNDMLFFRNVLVPLFNTIQGCAIAMYAGTTLYGVKSKDTRHIQQASLASFATWGMLCMTVALILREFLI